jgi:aminoglycoside phosphotransferase (APT) family kinase protein
MTEALDIEQPAQLIAYLQHAGQIGVEEAVTIRVLAGGVSNRVVLLERPDGARWVLKQALAKLRVPLDWFSSPERIHREALGLRWLPQLAPAGAITPLIFEDHDQHVLAMQAVGEPHVNWKTALLGGRVHTNHVTQFGCLIGAIHRAASGRAELERVFADQSFFETLRIEPYYGYTASQVPETAAFYAMLIADTRAERRTLVHGDYSPKNILIHQDRLILLDHEVIHFGDPAFDLGFSLTHLLSKAHHLLALRKPFVQAALRYWGAYDETLGPISWRSGLEPRIVRHTLGCLLARVAGRSTLEYLDVLQRQRQRRVVARLMQRPPATVAELIAAFITEIEAE